MWKEHVSRAEQSLLIFYTAVCSLSPLRHTKLLHSVPFSAQLWFHPAPLNSLPTRSTLFILCDIIVICHRKRKNTPAWLLSFLFKALCGVHWAAAVRLTMVWAGGLYCAIHRCILGPAYFHLMVWAEPQQIWSRRWGSTRSPLSLKSSRSAHMLWLQKQHAQCWRRFVLDFLDFYTTHYCFTVRDSFSPVYSESHLKGLCQGYPDLWRGYSHP